jgi:hypothetical protein
MSLQHEGHEEAASGFTNQHKTPNYKLRTATWNQELETRNYKDHIHFKAPFLCAYKNPINNMKKKIMISTSASQPVCFATTAQG